MTDKQALHNTTMKENSIRIYRFGQIPLPPVEHSTNNFEEHEYLLEGRRYAGLPKYWWVARVGGADSNIPCGGGDYPEFVPEWPSDQNETEAECEERKTREEAIEIISPP